MKLVNFNVAIKINNTEQVIKLLKEQNADFIVLQETARHLEDTVRAPYRSHSDIKTALRQSHPHNFFGPVWLGDAFRFSGEIELDFGGHAEQGLDVFSKYPIAEATQEFFYKHYKYMLDWANWQKTDHGRAVQITLFDIGGKPLQILNVHGIWLDRRQDWRRTNYGAKQIPHKGSAASESSNHNCRRL